MKSTVTPEITNVIEKIECLPFFQNMNLATLNNIARAFTGTPSSSADNKFNRWWDLGTNKNTEIFFYAHCSTGENKGCIELNIIDDFNDVEWVDLFFNFCEQLSYSEVKDFIVFQQGDVVKHVSNPHYQMSVISTIKHDKSALCEWVSGTGELQVRNVHFCSLINVLDPKTISVHKLFYDNADVAHEAVVHDIYSVADILSLGRNNIFINCYADYINNRLQKFGYQLKPNVF